MRLFALPLFPAVASRLRFEPGDFAIRVRSLLGAI